MNIEKKVSAISKRIAVDFTEKFQDQYPQRPIFEITNELAERIKTDTLSILNTVIEECIQAVQSVVKPHCSDHTPYMGACMTCGSRENDDEISEWGIEKLKGTLEGFKVKTSQVL